MKTLSQELIETQTEAPTATDGPASPRTVMEEPSAQRVFEGPHRPAWVEIDLDRLRHNFQIINRDKPPGLQWISVVKDDAYGHGANQVLNVALAEGASFVALSTLEEAVFLRDRGIRAPILLLGQRQES